MKKCSKCNIEKDLDEFYKRKDSKDGYRADCKKCKDSVSKKYAEKNIEKIRKIKNKYYQDNKCDVIERTKKWQYKNKERYCEISKKYRNKSDVKEKNKNKYLENKEYHSLKSKKWKEKNKQKINEKHRFNYENNSLYKLKFIIRGIIYKSISRNGYKRGSRSEEILGCSFNDFKSYIENKFELWMSWENHGKYNGEFNYGWDIDHIIPISSAKSEEELLKLNHYSNLQPLCSKINRDIKRIEDMSY